MSNMTKTEKRAILSLSSIMGLRMLGLFMVLPVFSIYAEQLTQASPFLIGVAVGIYGLSQAICQIPFGTLSDRFGRKSIIYIGLLLFATGSLIAGLAHHIGFMILGRALQGCGAIGSTLLAMLADLTREEQRTRSMAIAGITIGFSFSLSMLCGPLLLKWLAVNDIFFIAMILAMVCMSILFFFTPTPLVIIKHSPLNYRLFLDLFTRELIRLNMGIFILHAVFTASFIIIPLSLLQFGHLNTQEQWKFYLPTLLVALFSSLLFMQRAEKKRQIKSYFLLSILLLGIGLFFLWVMPFNHTGIYLGLISFFTGFSLLEAFLPSLVSRVAPQRHKGSALGIYSCAQFFGIFIGGLMGGWLYGQFHFTGVYVFCMLLIVSWLFFAAFMQPPCYWVTDLLHLSPIQSSRWDVIAIKLQSIPGMKEITFVAEDKLAYLKMEPSTKKHPDFISLKETLSQPI